MMAVDVNIVRVFGPMPDGIDLTENRAKHMDEGNIALIVLALLAVVLRFWARFVQQAGFKADDYLVALALVGNGNVCANKPLCSDSLSCVYRSFRLPRAS